MPIGGQRVGERLTCGDRGRAALRDPAAGVGRGAPPPPQHGPSPGGEHRDDTGGGTALSRRCRDTVTILSRRYAPSTHRPAPASRQSSAPLSGRAGSAGSSPRSPPHPPSPLSDWSPPSGGARRLASPAPRPRPSSGRAHKMAAAAVRGIGAGLGRGVRELRLHLCQSSAGSRGVR